MGSTKTDDMKPTAEKASTGEWYGVVIHCRKELYRTATTSLDKAAAIKRAQNWIMEQNADERKRKEKQKKDNDRKRLQKLQKQFKEGDVVKGPGGLGTIQRISPYGLLDVKYTSGITQSVMKDQLKRI